MFILILIFHFIITFPSIIYHSFLNRYERYTDTNIYDDRILVNKNIIVCIHGRNGYPTDFTPLIKNLKQSKKIMDSYEILLIKLGDTSHTSIDDDANIVHKKLSIHKNCNYTLIGLSKGGLVAMRYATKYKSSNIDKIITISSPLYGTYIASLFPKSSEVYKSLSYNNDIVKNIDESRKDNSNSYVLYHIVPTYDFMIIPVESSYYNDTPTSNIYNYKGSVYGHTGIMYSNDVLNAIINWL